MRAIVAASAIGTTIEWYDFLIYSTAAALVLNRLFFPTHDPLVGRLLAIGTIGVGFVARPLGAIVLSHFGDRLGRKSMLILTLVSMGVATTLIGLLPGYATIGVAAPMLLVACRLVQGIAVGGEWGGAVLMATEHSPADRRGFYGSIVQIGFPLGMALGTASFLALARLDDAAFMSWGWRLPFLGSAVLVAVGTFIRLRVDETPDFRRDLREGRIVRFPVLDALRRHPKDVLIGLGARITEISWIYLITIFGLSYAVTSMGLSRGLVLGAIALGATIELITIPLCGALSDRIGRRPIYVLGCLAAIALAFPLFWAIESRDARCDLAGVCSDDRIRTPHDDLSALCERDRTIREAAPDRRHRAPDRCHRARGEREQARGMRPPSRSPRGPLRRRSAAGAARPAALRVDKRHRSG